MASVSPESAWEFAEAIKSVVGKPTTKRRATVQSVDKDGTIWVQLPGSANTTPIASTGANVSPGDTVLTELRGTQLHITENSTDPAIGQRTAGDIARQAAKPAVDAAKAAEGIAGEAKSIASATGQHFWDDDNGAHVTDVTKDEWTAAAADDFSDLSDAKPYHNLLMNSLGILLRRALNNLVSISRSAIAFYDGLGNNAANIVASFGTNGAQIGKTGERHLELTPEDGLNVWHGTGKRLAHISDDIELGQLSDSGEPLSSLLNISIGGIKLRNRLLTTLFEITNLYDDANGGVPKIDTFECDGAQEVFFTSYHAGSIGHVKLNSTYLPHGSNTGYFYTDFTKDGKLVTRITLGSAITPPAAGSTLEVYYYVDDQSIFAATVGTRANSDPTQQGWNSFAAGVRTKARGERSIAIGTNAWAESDDQIAFGKYNEVDDNGDYALIVGNGTDDANRSNAHTLDWNGNAVYAGDVTDGTGNVLSDKADSADLGALATKSTLTIEHTTIESTSVKNSSAVASGGNVNFTCTCTVPDGYTFAGIQRVGRGGGAGLVLLGFLASDNGNSATLSFRNLGSSSIAANTASATCEFRFIKVTAS